MMLTNKSLRQKLEVEMSSNRSENTMMYKNLEYRMNNLVSHFQMLMDYLGLSFQEPAMSPLRIVKNPDSPPPKEEL